MCGLRVADADRGPLLPEFPFHRWSNRGQTSGLCRAASRPSLRNQFRISARLGRRYRALHQIDVTDGGDYTRIVWPEGMPVTLGLGI